MTVEMTGIGQRVLLGSRINEVRLQRRMSLREVGSYADVSASFLSQVERGQSGASVSTLMRIAAALGVSMSDLFAPDAPPRASLVRREDRPVIDAGAGFRKTLVSQRPIRHIEACIGEFEPGGSTGEPYTHGDSQEIILVLRGEISVTLDSRFFELSQGDSLEYQTSVPHGITNTGSTTAEVLYMVSPSTGVGSHEEHRHARMTGAPSADSPRRRLIESQPTGEAPASHPWSNSQP